MDPWQPSDPTLPSALTTAERELIRREMGPRFGLLPSLADDLLPRTWRDGPQKGEPKPPPAVRSMLRRVLSDLAPSGCRSAILPLRSGAGPSVLLRCNGTNGNKIAVVP